MLNNYFERLRASGRRLEKNIKELEEEWQLPQLFVGGCADVTKETEERIESLKNTLQCTKDGVDELLRMKEIDTDTDDIIKEVQLLYDTMKQDVDNLETVFKEYGYCYEKQSTDNSLEIKETEIISNCPTEKDSIEEIIFTPDIIQQCKKKSINTSSLSRSNHLSEKSAILRGTANNILECKPNGMSQMDSTNRLVSSVNISDCNNKFKSTLFDSNGKECSETHKKYLTPLRDKPRVPIYSKHFYSLSKKNIAKQF